MSFLLLTLFWASASTVASLTECDVYHVLNETHRSTAYKTTYPEHPLCDDTLPAGWYRFQNGAGDKMPEQCVDREHCGTVVPLWLNGTHPTVAEGRVYRYVCANLQSGASGATPCCEQRVKIAVRNCQDFYVYYVQPTPSCPMAYCAGDKPPCPYGQWSKTGFAPCKNAHPDLKDAPKLSGPEIRGKQFYFDCEVNLPDDDPDQRIEVTFTFDGAADPAIPGTILQDPDRRARLDGSNLRGHLGKSVGCKVRAYYEDNKEHPSAWVKANNPYWAGIRVSPGSLVVSEAEPEKNVTLSSTLPILCNHDNQCCLQIRLDVNGRSDDARVRGCVHALCGEDWKDTLHSASVQVPVIAARDQISDNDKHLVLEFETLQDNFGGNYTRVFQGYNIPSLAVHVKDAEVGSCSITNDPYLHNLSGRQYTFQRLGDFTLFANKDRDFEIQVRTGPCVHTTNLPGTCVCGVAIREKDDLVYAYSCGAVDWDRHWHVRSLRLVKPRDLSEGTVIKRSSDGQQIVVYLPSSAEVKIQAFTSVLNLFLTIPSIDKGRGRGLCGTFDGNTANDFTLRNGTVASAAEANSNTFNTPFLLSWANDHETSLFRKLPALVKDKQETAYCQCVNNAINCTTRGDVTGRILNCQGVCQEGGRGFTPDPLVPVDLMDVHFENNRRRRAIQEGTAYMDRDDLEDTLRYDPDQYQDLLPTTTPEWPTPSGVTEAQAEASCLQSVSRSPLWNKLLTTNPQRAHDLISNCKSDILLSDSHDFLESLVDAATTSSQVELAKDPSNFVTTAGGDNVLKPEVSSDLCNVECLRHGRCVRGTCVCSANYTGDNCQLLAGLGPQLHRVSGSGACDIRRRPCRMVFLEASNFQMGASFDCKIREIMPDGSFSPDVMIESADFVTTTKLTCPLPDSRDRSWKRYGIQVTSDGSLYGNQVNVTVYDSVCQNCTSTHCERVSGACLIDNMCFADLDGNPKDVSQRCITGESADHWTKIFPTATAELSGPDSDGDLVCSVNTSDTNPAARYKVTWFLGGERLSAVTELAVGTLRATHARRRLTENGTVTCEVTGYYTNRHIDSPAVQSNRVDLSRSTRYPFISVELTAPNSGNGMVCAAHTNETSNLVRYKVSWYLADSWHRELGVTTGSDSAVYSRADMPATGTLRCRMRSYYSDVNVFSPYFASNSMDLQAIPKNGK